MGNQEKKYIYVIQMHTGTLPGRVIRLVTRYQYSHVVLSLDRDCKTTYSFGRKGLYNFLNSGFVEEQQDGAFFRRFAKTRCRIYEIEVTWEQYARLKDMLEDRKSREHEYGYDFVGLVLRTFYIPVSFENKAVCSQFVAELLEAGDVVRFGKPCYFVRARDFDDHRELRAVYEGLYSEYRLA